ncbi:hypothetical protein HZA99_06215, partial [Candidatus Woesearchaeota archaeon]|nr:hypothetical protein [Candidatus Woesearchaeota archaeon]
LKAYERNAPREQVVQRIVENERAMEEYLGTLLPKEEEEAHYLDMAVLPIKKGWLTDKGYGDVLTVTAEKASPETVAEATAPYLTTPEARKTVLTTVVGQMSPEERVQFVQGLTANLPQKEYDVLIVALTPRLSTDGYAQVEKQVNDKKWDERFEKGKEAMDRVRDIIKK